MVIVHAHHMCAEVEEGSQYPATGLKSVGNHLSCCDLSRLSARPSVLSYCVITPNGGWHFNGIFFPWKIREYIHGHKLLKKELNCDLKKQSWELGFYKTKAHLVAGSKLDPFFFFLKKKECYFSNKKYQICYFHPERKKYGRKHKPQIWCS